MAQLQSSVDNSGLNTTEPAAQPMPQPFTDALRTGLGELVGRLPLADRFQALVNDQLGQLSAQLQQDLSSQMIQTSGHRIQLPLLPKSLSAADATRFVADICDIAPPEMKHMADAFGWVGNKISGGESPLIAIDEQKIPYPWMRKLLDDVRDAAPGWTVSLGYRWGMQGAASAPEVLLQLTSEPKELQVKKMVAPALQRAGQQQEMEEVARSEREQFKKHLVSSIKAVATEAGFLTLGSFALASVVRRINEMSLMDPPLLAVTRFSSVAVGGIGALLGGLVAVGNIGNPIGQVYLGALVGSNLIALGLEIYRHAAKKAKEGGRWG